MTTVKCAQCGELHDLSDIEPSLKRPDPLLDIPDDLRPSAAYESKDNCILFNEESRSGIARLLRRFRRGGHRYFLRVLVPFSVDGRQIHISWGMWIEVPYENYRRVRELWSDPDQHREPPFHAQLANNIWGYPPTLGLDGYVYLQSPHSIPKFLFSDSNHPFVAEQRTGVTEARVLDWLDPILHQS